MGVPPIAPGGDGRGQGNPTNQKSQHFDKVRTNHKRDNLERGYMSASEHVWHGMNDVIWAILHPDKSIPRGFGQAINVVTVVTVVGTIGYIFFGDPGSAKISFDNPSSMLKVAADNTVRPVFRWVRRAGSGAVDSVGGGDGDRFDGEDYRE